MSRYSRREFLATLALSAALAPLAQGEGASAPALGKKPRAPAADTPGTSLEALALSRLTFGARPADYEHFRALGADPSHQLEAYIERGLHPDKIQDADFDYRLGRLALPTLNKSLEQLWKDHLVAADALKDSEAAKAKAAAPSKPEDKNKKAQMDENSIRLQPAKDVEAATWLRAVYSQRQLQEVLANFWHDHFNVYAWDNRVSATFVHYDRDVIRKHLFGNFRAFLEAVAQSPAMLHFLDNELNQSGNPNENFARELFELHALGAENYLGTMDRTKVPGYAKGEPPGYVDGDVYEAARAFTGWRVEADKKGANSGRFEYFEPWHDRFQKIVLGKSFKEYQPPQKDGREVLDLLANHPGTARFICRKLCRRLVADQPPESLVAKAAKVFRENHKKDDQLLRVTREILLSEEFAASGSKKLKRPFEYVAGILRQSDADFIPTDDFLRNFERTGQKLFSWRTPDGMPDVREKWASSNSLLERWRLTNQLLGGQFKEIRVAALEGKPPSAEEYFAYWQSRIFPAGLAPHTRETVLAYLGKAPDEARARMGVALLFQSPENQWR
jgi:uncharacterized protein (DUF1800 family)